MTVALAFGFDRSFLWSAELQVRCPATWARSECVSWRADADRVPCVVCVQHNLVSIQPHMIERLRLRYIELCSFSSSTSVPRRSSDALAAECRLQSQPNAQCPRAYDDDEEAEHSIAASSSLAPPLHTHLRLIVCRDADGDGGVVSSRARVEAFFVRWDDFTQRYCMKANKGRDECVLQAFRHGRRPHDAEFDRLFALFAWLLHESRLLFRGEGSDPAVSSITTALAQISLDLGDDASDAVESQLEPVVASSAVHTELSRSLGTFFGDDSDVVRGFLDADFVFSSTDGQALRWRYCSSFCLLLLLCSSPATSDQTLLCFVTFRSYLLAHLMRDITDAVLGLFGLRQTKSDDYPAPQLRQINDMVLRRANIAISSQVEFLVHCPVYLYATS
jgi:hypothetical protein